MCGRYTVSTPADLVAELFGLDAASLPEFAPRYNVAPTQEAPVVRAGADGRPRLELLRWGLVPYWADDPKIGSRMINARADTAAEKPAFRDAFKRRRCLVVTDGFYEWKKEETGKQPFWIHRADGAPFAFAGLWERWRPRGQPAAAGGEVPPLETFTILTTDAAAEVAPLHDRMPVIVDPGDFALWLDPAVADRDRLARLLVPREGLLTAHPVSRRVNSPANEGPENVEPVATAAAT